MKVINKLIEKAEEQYLYSQITGDARGIGPEVADRFHRRRGHRPGDLIVQLSEEERQELTVLKSEDVQGQVVRPKESVKRKRARCVTHSSKSSI